MARCRDRHRTERTFPPYLYYSIPRAGSQAREKEIGIRPKWMIINHQVVDWSGILYLYDGPPGGTNCRINMPNRADSFPP